ncbi:MAG: fructosamine kinase family protein [Chitinophagaceae bacterium]|jgi:fructosamine-3-kinase|nr:fructosamine kinase family protein [Chitinophagaceae bacterium]
MILNFDHDLPDHLRQIIKSFFNKTGITNEERVAFEKISGGCINTCYRVTARNNRSLLVKYNNADAFPGMLKAEKTGLAFLQKQGIINIPEVLGFQQVNENQVLILEWINESKPNRDSWKKLGEQLAGLHQVTNLQFGFEEDNYIGSLPQDNSWDEGWINFFVEHRLKPQIDLAIKKGLLTSHHSSLFKKLLIALPDIFDDEQPALLHGDLWRGNLLFDERQNPVLIDPAVYFGNRHMDLAMTTLFGGFDPAFYESYHYFYPLPKNHKQQWEICNLYPLLVHVNLFGESYVPKVRSVLKKFS